MWLIPKNCVDQSVRYMHAASFFLEVLSVTMATHYIPPVFVMSLAS